MSESGAGIAAAQQREEILASRNTTAAGADTQLQTLLRTAHATADRYAQRLDTIEKAINEAVARQASMALNTAAGARQFQQFLAAKHSEILTVLDDAQQSNSELQTQIQALSGHYDLPADTPTIDPNQPLPPYGVTETPALTRGDIDGIHGTGDHSMPIIKKPGELGPSGFVEPIPGTGIWVWPDQVSDNLVIVPPGALAPSNTQQIGTAPDGSGIWWYVPPGPR